MFMSKLRYVCVVYGAIKFQILVRILVLKNVHEPFVNGPNTHIYNEMNYNESLTPRKISCKICLARSLHCSSKNLRQKCSVPARMETCKIVFPSSMYLCKPCQVVSWARPTHLFRRIVKL